MTAETYETLLGSFRKRLPFRVFTVELIGGKRLEVDHANALTAFYGTSFFVSPGGTLVLFDSHSVLRFIDAGIQSDA